MPRAHHVRDLLALVVSAAMIAVGCGRTESGLELPPRPAKIERLEALYAPDNAAALATLEKWKTEPPVVWAYNVAALASRLGPTVEGIFTLVRDDIRYEVYEGVLRGPLGTLMTTAGNSYDKTLLLAALLRHHGIEVRFVRGMLTPERAAVQVAQMFAAARSPSPPASTGRGGRPEVAAAAREQMALQDWYWAVGVSDIRAALESKKLQLGKSPPVPGDSLVREASDHLWLEYAKGQEWVALDPSVSGAQIGQTFADRRDEWTEIPDALFHRVEIRVVVEQRGPNGIQSSDVLRHEVNAADLEGASVILTHRVTADATGWAAAPALRMGTRTIDGTEFAGSGLAAGARDLGRRVFRPSGSPAATGGELAGEWLEIAFSVPSGATETVRRSIIDRIGPAARQERREKDAPLMPLPEVRGIPLAFGNVYALSFSSGNVHPGLAFVELTQQFSDLRTVVQAMPHLQAGKPDPSGKPDAAIRQASAAIAPTLLSLVATSFHALSRFYIDRLTAGYPAGHTLFYGSSPRLVITAIEMLGPGADKKVSVRISLDLRRNGLRVVGEGIDGTQLVWANVVRGVLDAALEHVLVAPTKRKTPTSTVSAAAVLSGARGAKIPIAAVTTSQQIQTLPVSPVARARMLNALADGTVIVAPARPVTIEGSTHFAWWEVDPASGETLAVGETGLHQGGSEYTLVEALGEVVIWAFWGVVADLFLWVVANVVVELLTCGIDYMGPAPGPPGAFLRPAPPGTRHREGGWIGGCYPYTPPPPGPSRCHPFACQGPGGQGGARG